MLTLTGKALDVSSETIEHERGSFISTTVSLLTGKAQIERVRLGKDFPKSEVPREGEDVQLAVVIAAYATRQGAGYRLTAVERVRPGARAAAPVGASSN